MCPTCKTRLDQSSSPQANQIRRELARLRARGESRSDGQAHARVPVRLRGAGGHAALGIRRAGLARADGARPGGWRARRAACAPLAWRRARRRPPSQAPSGTGSSSSSTTSSRGSSEPGDVRSGLRRGRALVRDALRAAARPGVSRGGRRRVRRRLAGAPRGGTDAARRGPLRAGLRRRVRDLRRARGCGRVGARRLAGRGDAGLGHPRGRDGPGDRGRVAAARPARADGR